MNQFTKRLCFLLFLFALKVMPVFAQNLIINGSMNSTKGADVVAPGWYKYSNYANANTPDINDSAGGVNTTPGYVWADGTPVSSPDGGTWQNVFTGENFAQDIKNITIGDVYYFKYYYASQGISAGPPTPDIATPFPPSVTIVGANGYTNPPAGKLFQWNTYFGTLTATDTVITIIASAGTNQAYMAFDGFYLSKVPPPDMIIYSQPLPDTICNTGNANFTVHAVAGATFQWQVNEGGTWQNITDNNQYSGSMSDSLNISNTNAGMNNYQYRCYVSTACCNVYSAPATLVVLPYFTPSVTITTASSNICKQDTAVFTASVSTSPQNNFFQWKKNEVNVGEDTMVYSDGNISNADVISCILTTNEACATPVSVVSNKIKMTVENCADELSIPTAFTPNDDGLNDIFKAIYRLSVKQFSMVVYNRFGQIVFQSFNIANGWDGNYRNKAAPVGAYIYTVAFTSKNNMTKTKHGTVLLIR